MNTKLNPGPPASHKILTWDHKIQSCNKCDISKYCKHKVTHSVHIPFPTNRKTIDILFIGEAPGQVEYAEKETFIGPAGICLREIITESVPSSMSYLLTNAILCTPFLDSSRYNLRPPSLSEIKECSPHIKSLIKLIKPKKIILLGKVAARCLPDIPLPPTLTITHPAAIMQSTKSTYDFDNAVLKIKEFLKSTPS